MKTRVLFLLTAICWLSFTSLSFAQKGIRIGYIDMDYILENVPEYGEASAQLDSKVQKWKTEIEVELKEIEQMRKDLSNERVLLTKELIEEREEDIAFKEKEILEYQQKRFGPNGDLFLQKKRLIQPVQDQVFTAVQEIAKNKRYDFIFDKASDDALMLYSADRYDVSDQVLLRINRASRRKQAKNKKERRAIEEGDKRNLEQEKNVTERDEAQQARLAEREKLIEERRLAREKVRAQKKKEYEERRAKLLAERQRKKDSITALREQKQKEKENNNN